MLLRGSGGHGSNRRTTSALPLEEPDSCRSRASLRRLSSPRDFPGSTRCLHRCCPGLQSPSKVRDTRFLAVRNSELGGLPRISGIAKHNVDGAAPVPGKRNIERLLDSLGQRNSFTSLCPRFVGHTEMNVDSGHVGVSLDSGVIRNGAIKGLIPETNRPLQMLQRLREAPTIVAPHPLIEVADYQSRWLSVALGCLVQLIRKGPRNRN